jgi:uncharacterized protein YkwD
MIFFKKFITALIILVRLSQTIHLTPKSYLTPGFRNDSFKPQDKPSTNQPGLVLQPTQEFHENSLQPKGKSSSNGNCPGSSAEFNPNVVLELVNELRNKNRKHPLELHPELVQDAYEHSVYMEYINDLSHRRLPQDSMNKSLEKKGLNIGN